MHRLLITIIISEDITLTLESKNIQLNIPKYYLRLNSIYNFFSIYFFWILRYIIIFICFLFNKELTSPYSNLISKEIFIEFSELNDYWQNCTGILVSIIVVIWTFTLSISIYCLGKLDSRFYGIKFSELIISYLSPYKIIFITFTILFELIMVFISIAFNWNVLIFTLGVFQFLSMLFAILMVYIETSYYTIKYRIILGINEDEENKNDKWMVLLSHMLRNMDFSNDDDTDDLLQSIIGSISLRYEENWFEISNIAKKILSSKTNDNDRKNFIHSWIANIENNKPSLEPRNRLLVKKGLFCACVEYFLPDDYDHFINILYTQKQEIELISIWCIAANIYFEKFNDQHWRSIFTKKLIRLQTNEWTEDNINLLYTNLIEISNSIETSNLIENSNKPEGNLTELPVNLSHIYKYFTP